MAMRSDCKRTGNVRRAMIHCSHRARVRVAWAPGVMLTSITVVLPQPLAPTMRVNGGVNVIVCTRQARERGQSSCACVLRGAAPRA